MILYNHGMRMVFRVNWGNRYPNNSHAFELPSKEFPEGRAFIYHDRVWSAKKDSLGYEKRGCWRWEESLSWTARRNHSVSWPTNTQASQLNVGAASDFSRYRFLEIISDKIQVKREMQEQDFIPPES